MKKIIHFSDLHISTRKKFRKRFEYIMEKMTGDINNPEDYVVVITGDLAENCNEWVFRKVKSYFDTLERAGFKVLFTPGNHDYARVWGVGGDWDSRKVFNQIFFGSGAKDYPTLFKTDDRKIAFIGIDSLAGYLEDVHNYTSGARGKIGANQLRRLGDMLNQEVNDCTYKVVYLHHHPFKGLHAAHKLVDAVDFLRLIIECGNVDAILFGHNHWGWEWNGFLENVPRCYDAGSSTGKKENDQTNPHRVIDLSQGRDTDYDANFIAGFYG